MVLESKKKIYSSLKTRGMALVCLALLKTT